MDGWMEVRKGRSVGSRADGRGHWGGGRKSCHRCLAAELGMRLWDWVWEKRKKGDVFE